MVKKNFFPLHTNVAVWIYRGLGVGVMKPTEELDVENIEQLTQDATQNTRALFSHPWRCKGEVTVADTIISSSISSTSSSAARDTSSTYLVSELV